MAADAFNSVGGYTVGIPPYQVIDETGNITTTLLTVTDINGSGNVTISGNIVAGNLIGNIVGNISGTITAPGFDTQVLYNSNGEVAASDAFTFDSSVNLVTITGDLVANSFTIGSGTNQFSTASVLFATTTNNAVNQPLHRSRIDDICSIDYTIIATDSSNNRQISKLFAGVMGDEVSYFEYGTIDVPQESPGVGDFKVVFDAGDVVLTVNPVSSQLTNYKIMITSYKA